MGRKTGRKSRGSDYPRFAQLDGEHPYRSVPGGHVAYAARRRRGGEVVWFNFDLAREMGLVPRSHADRLTAGLRRAILDTFALRIVNEYDVAHGARSRHRDRLPGTYMATRYLQLQHPGRVGATSGDGRSIWNGCLRYRNTTWDVTSCGTGVTRLCPATAKTGAYFQSGNWQADYGCGTATVEEGLVAALMSETFHRNGIATERVLAVLEFGDGFAVNVRAGSNLLRPSHLFVHLKQGNLRALRAAAGCLVARSEANGDAPKLRGRRRWEQLAATAARTFGRLAATLEAEYIFCWLDWDGDNILADGGIIDYGSVRQFGLYHREYRFDDGPRWSTTIPEQRSKARWIVRNFAQMRDYLIEGRKPSLRSLRRDPMLRLFDESYREERRLRLLCGAGIAPPIARRLAAERPRVVRDFRRAHAWFEHARSERGPRRTEDGITWNAVHSTRDLLRELPRRLLAGDGRVAPHQVLEMAASTYASAADRKATPHRRRMAGRFLRAYRELIEAAAALTGCAVPLLLNEIAGRSEVINRYDRITGDAAIYAAERLRRDRRRLGPEGLYRIVRRFVAQQTRVVEERPEIVRLPARPDARRVFDALLEALAALRHGL